VDLQQREIYIRGKRGKDWLRGSIMERRRVDRYLRVRAGHPQAYPLAAVARRRGPRPLTRDGIYQMVRRRGDHADVRVYPTRTRSAPFQSYLGRAEGDLMELNGWSSSQMLERYGGSARGARALRHYDLVMDD
jgi:hypothetical protein